MAQATGKVCVTGAGGYLGSWVVKHLLSNNYTVHATVRQPGDAKYAHLNQLERASHNLQLFKADLLDYDSLCSAISGCTGVFHVASPVPTTTVSNPQVEVIEPAVKGTLNVLKACVEAKVKRVVVVSSRGAVALNPRWPVGQIKDEACWSDKEHCAATKKRRVNFEFKKSSGLDVVTVCPSLILGPLLQPTINASSLALVRLLKGYDTLEEKSRMIVEFKVRMIVDVRDVAEALLLVYEKAEAEGRYICMAHLTNPRDLVDKLRSIFPQYDYPKRFIEGGEEDILSSEKLQRLGWSYRPLEETLVDSIESYKKAGILD
ncbi:hypothetical protein E1A91_D05G298300v1 [Gossypium mustelinum]|uniref:NAD-dependent epimerase/dehydratase domain-containing protein n=1 Tax=Gossypium mustelinum TaxID=34275 RepID=A0A5D2V2L8_GOSMU|nr:hypothetical protein E1A91_D05G298300v1 [Gossypium mustelinum]